MRISFERPWLLLILIPLLALTLVPYFLAKKKGQNHKRRTVSLILRALAFVLLVSSLAGLTAVRKTKNNAILVLADLSDSTRILQEEFADAYRTAQKYADKNTEVGLVTFGYNSLYEIPLTKEPSFRSFETVPQGNYTDIYSALIKAAAMMPADANKRIILLTDGKENIGKVKEAASLLNSKGIRLDAILKETGATESEIQLTDIAVPDVVYEGEDFTLTVTVESSYDCTANLILRTDDMISFKSEISLNKGTNRFLYRMSADCSGISSYTAEITALKDSVLKNNKIYTFVNILGTPKILLVDGTGSESHELTQILDGRVLCEVTGPANVPDNMADLRKYNAVVLMNVRKSQLPEGWDSLLEVYVRQLGRGLLATGGSSAFALGGWADTDLEKILPVNMMVTDEHKMGSMSLMILIDTSGSMGNGFGSPLELAKSGGIKAVDTLREKDKIGVISFSDGPTWISRLNYAEDKKAVQSRIAAIPPGGGTMVFRALQLAEEALKDDVNQSRSIILLTDGEPADGDHIFTDKMTERLTSENISITSIGVGTGANREFLERLAKETGGSYVPATDVKDLPNIILDETFKAISKGYLFNDPFRPQVSDYTQVLTGVQSLPGLNGYILTEIKPLAYNVLTTPDGDPVYAEWRYGLGKTAVWAGDLNGKWSRQLLNTESGLTLIRNMISGILPSEDNSETGSVTVKREGNKGIITLQSPVTDRQLKTAATVLSPTGAEQTVELVPSGIGTYSGSFFLEEEGSYVVIADQEDEKKEPVMHKESALSVKYSDEYDVFAKDYGYVSDCCLAAGGKADWKTVEEILSQKITGSEENLKFFDVLIPVGLILIFLDIAIRRLKLDFAAIFRKKQEAAEGAEAPQTPGNKKPKSQDVRKNLTEKKENSAEKKPLKATGKPPKTDGAASGKSDTKPEEDSSGVASLLKAKDNMKRTKL